MLGAPEHAVALGAGDRAPLVISAFEWTAPYGAASSFEDGVSNFAAFSSSDLPDSMRYDEQLRSLAEVPVDAPLTPSRVWLYGGTARTWKPGALVAVPDGAQLWPGEILCVIDEFALVEYEHDKIGHTALRLVRRDGAPIIEAPDPQQNIDYADCPVELRMAIRAADLDWAGRSLHGDVLSLFDPEFMVRDSLLVDQDTNPRSTQ
jgi:hypothetical protein